MAMFITKVWAFPVPHHPLIFTSEGWRTNAIKALEKGDLVVLAGTWGKETNEEDKGRLLGVIEPTPRQVDTKYYLDAKGARRWPYGLEIEKAWKIEKKVFLKEIVKRKLERHSMSTVVRLEKSEEQEIRKLKKHYWAPVEVQPKKSQRNGFDFDKEDVEIEKSGRKGPRPSDKPYSVINRKKGPAHTYCMAITGGKVKKNLFKIGYSNNHKGRERNFNYVALSDIGGVEYKLVLQQKWKTADEAYDMEQILHRELKKYQYGKNQEVICAPLGEIKKAWDKAITEMKK